MFHNNYNMYKKKIILSFLSILPTCFIFSQEIPQVVDNSVIFHENKNQIQLGKNDYYHIFNNQKRLVYIQQQKKPNYGQYILLFYDFYGNKITQTDMIIGEINFVFVKTTGRVLAGQISMLTRQNKSYLYNLDGKLLNILVHDFDTKQIGLTEDEKYFWFAANKMRQLNSEEKPLLPNWTHIPYNHIMIFDVNTGNFLLDFSTLEDNFSFSANGKKYTIPVSLPDIPG